ncbi:MAG: hypothetical protein LBU87_00705 [Lactobacillales bacterium]|jgi:TPR repeat protein|nr:hypothetical protein [Lactobacillales bacterium]
MKSKFLYAALGTLFFSNIAAADLSDAITSFDNKRYNAALDELIYLSDEGNPTATYYLGRIYKDGLGTDANLEKALAYFKKASDENNVEATVELAKILLTNDKDDVKQQGIQYLKKAGFEGNAEALYELGNIYTEGTLVKKEYSYAFGYYLMSALKGDKKAQHKLSQFYFQGRGTTQDYENGLKWLSRSANQGYVIAQQDLADFRASDPRLKNTADAYAWYSIIAAYNTDEIGKNAAEMRDRLGGSLKKTAQLLDIQKRARDWRPITPEQSVSKEDLLTIPRPIIPGFNDPETIQKMLEAGDVILTDGSRYNISNEMINKAIAEKNFDPIEKNVMDAVKNGKKDAYAYYGDLLRTRLKQPGEALEWYRKGANADEVYAQFQLAKMYCEGIGVEAPDAIQCYSWLLRAKKNDSPQLKYVIQSAIDTVETNATPEELEEGKKLADKDDNSGNVKKEPTSGGFNFF